MKQWVHRRARRATITRRRRRTDESGFSLVEVLAASSILIIIVVSMSNLLVDSMRVALVSKQSEVAASIASDVVENAKALGQSALSSVTASCASPTSSATTYGSATVPVPLPVLTAATVGQCFNVFVDSFSYLVTPTPTAPSGASPEAIKVIVSWSSGSTTLKYYDYSFVGS